MSEGCSNTKAIRQAHSCLEQIQTRQYQLAALLHRIYYKSKAQHRSAKWFQSISGMRKCFTRLLDMDIITLKMDESMPDRGVNAKGRPQKSKKDKDKRGSLQAAKEAVGAVWSSMWGDERAQDGSLYKYVTPPTQGSNPRAELSAASKLLVVCIQIEELAKRARVSFNLAQIHLRTPPAPTFAPLVLSLLSLCAQIHSACLDALWKEEGLAHVYRLFRAIKESASTSKFLVLDGKKQIHRAAMERTLNLLQCNGESSLDRLPDAITRQEVKSEVTKSDEEIVRDKDSMLLDTSTYQALVDDDEEDLGEAV